MSGFCLRSSFSLIHSIFFWLKYESEDNSKNKFVGNLETIKKIKEVVNFSAIAYNEDYSVYARERDGEIEEWAESNNVEIIKEEDYGLLPIKDAWHHPKDGPPKPYDVLSIFFEVRSLISLYFNYMFKAYPEVLRY